MLYSAESTSTCYCCSPAYTCLAHTNTHAGSKWTAMHETLGWRHFRVTQQRKVPASTSSGTATAATSAGGSRGSASSLRQIFFKRH